MDYITVLKVRVPSDALMTKRLFRATTGAIGKTAYDKAFLFDVEKRQIDDLADLVDVMYELAWRSDCFVIRGKPNAYHGVRRKLHGAGAAFSVEPLGHHWMMIDFDQIPLPIFLEPDDDAELLLQYLVRMLPAAFHGASFYWQWSSGHGIDRTSLRGHLWFWSRDKHTDAEFENYIKWANGSIGEKLIDPAVFRTVQPNYCAAPILGEGVIDPVNGARHGVYVGATDAVVITCPTESWEQHVRELERAEYQELVEYGLRKPEAPHSGNGASSAERYFDYMQRIGDDKDGFNDPITKAIWHFASYHPANLDEAFKTGLREMVRAAVCTKQRDLDQYLSDYQLDASLRGAREKQNSRKLAEKNALGKYRDKLIYHLSHS